MALANFLLQLEDYKYAGELFELLSKRLEHDQVQAQKSLKNAHVSFKRGVTVYIQIGGNSLLEKKFDEALRYYTIAIDLMNKCFETASADELESLKKWLDSLIKAIKQKYLLFSDEYKLKITDNFKKLSFLLE